jgi:hypothetical protein
MSQRLLLRSAVVGALMNRTIAEGRVFDTMIGDVQKSADDQWLPFISVYTDIDRRRGQGAGDARQTYERLIDITIEIGVGRWTQQEVPAQGDAPPQMQDVFGLIETDAELEAVLDLFELQVFRSLHNPSPHALALHNMVQDWQSWDSIPGREGNGLNNKISCRNLTITVRVRDDCRPDARSIYPRFETLAPNLCALVTQIAKTPALASMREMLKELYGETPLPAPNPLLRFGMYVDARDVNVDVNLLPPGETQGPDGRVEIEGLVNLEGPQE